MKKIFIIVLIMACLFLFRYFEVFSYLNLEYIKANQEILHTYYLQNKITVLTSYFLLYVLVTAVSLPGATILTLLGGSLFGLLNGFILVSFASSIGATIAFLLSRILFKDYIEAKFSDKLKLINKGIEKDGAFYLFSLRLVPAFPFFLINILMGLTSIKVLTFYLVSQLGMIFGTLVYVNAGVEIAKITSLTEILSPSLLFSFTLLGIFPLMAKKILDFIKHQKIYKGHSKPKKFDYNMIVIGAGSAGLVTSYICATLKARVALIEKHKMGGDCLNTGCVPSKAIVKAAKMAYEVNQASSYGIKANIESIDFKQVMARVHKVIKKIEPHDSIDRYTELGVECISGEATILSPWEVKVNNKVLTSKNITIATGASPLIPNIKGLKEIDYLTSNNLWKLAELPKKFLVLGGGPIGLEMAQSFNRLGSKVTLIEMGDRIMSKEDEDVSLAVHKKLTHEGVNILTLHKAVEFSANKLLCEFEGKIINIEFDNVLIAIGRVPNLDHFGLENLKLEIRKNNTIFANEYMQTNYPNIYVCGDVTGPYQLTHTASHQAWYCAVNALFNPIKRFKVDYSVIPWCTYTDPEVATVGENESSAKLKNIEYEVTKYGLDDLDRAIVDGSDYGFVKVLTKKGSDQIIGATIVGVQAGELITEFITNMKYKKGLNAILGTIHTYPTLSEGNKYVAGLWKKNNAPVKLLSYVQKFHLWRRS